MNTITRKELTARLGSLQRAHTTDSTGNHIEVICENGDALFSYGVLVGVWTGCRWFFTNEHDYSRTTSKYVSAWCAFDTAERRKGLADGTFTLITD